MTKERERYEIKVTETKGKAVTANIIISNQRYILCVYPMTDNGQTKTIASLYISNDGEPYSVSSYEIMEDNSIKIIKVYKETRVLDNSIIEDCLAKINHDIAK